LGPLRDTKTWNTRGVEGVHRFLARSWRLVGGASNDDRAAADAETNEMSPFDAGAVSGAPGSRDDHPGTEEQRRATAKLVSKVTDDTEHMRYNTAISAMMEWVNAATAWDRPLPRGCVEDFVLCLAPYAPHLAEEMWAGPLGYGSEGTLSGHPWPVADESLLELDVVTLPVQVGGKLRGTVDVAADADEATALAAAVADGTGPAARWVEGKTVVKVTNRPGKILNLIVK